MGVMIGFLFEPTEKNASSFNIHVYTKPLIQQHMEFSIY